MWEVQNPADHNSHARMCVSLLFCFVIMYHFLVIYNIQTRFRVLNNNNTADISTFSHIINLYDLFVERKGW